MRLTEFQIQSIKECFQAQFGPNDHIWLFGSRTDPAKRGGDIDLYIETHEDDISVISKKERTFSVSLKIKIGDQKIDIVVNSLPLKKERGIYTEAKATGILIL